MKMENQAQRNDSHVVNILGIFSINVESSSSSPVVSDTESILELSSSHGFVSDSADEDEEEDVRVFDRRSSGVEVQMGPRRWRWPLESDSPIGYSTHQKPITAPKAPVAAGRVDEDLEAFVHLVVGERERERNRGQRVKFL
ncbi:hypothetical protein CsSME_00000617 [Camellia sinensis var. sinensis]